MSVQSISGLRQQQAGTLANFDVFWLCAALGRLALVLLGTQVHLINRHEVLLPFLDSEVSQALTSCTSMAASISVAGKWKELSS